MRICKEKIAHFKLEMNLVDVEYTFDNSKLLFYFTAEGRVDTATVMPEELPANSVLTVMYTL